MAELHAYVLVRTEPGLARRVAQSMLKIVGVDEARDVAGPFDVVARVRCRDLDTLGRIVVRQIQEVDGIVQTLTLPEMATA